jgi:hypothetical protein
MKILFLFAFTFVNLSSSCAHHRNVRPGASRIHKVVVMADDKECGTQDAIAEAHHFCKQYKKSAAFVSEKVEYTGDLDESAYKLAKAGTQIGKIFGGLSDAIGFGAQSAEIALGKMYRIEMDFECSAF